MTERDPEATSPIDETPEPAATPDLAPNDKTRRMLWAVGIGLGGYMIARGLWGVATGEGDQP